MTPCPKCGSSLNLIGRTKDDRARWRCRNKNCTVKTLRDNPRPHGRPMLGDRPMTHTESKRKNRQDRKKLEEG
jgi:hypothetical protein